MIGFAHRVGAVQTIITHADSFGRSDRHAFQNALFESGALLQLRTPGSAGNKINSIPADRRCAAQIAAFDVIPRRE
jgi:hypothetical protein